MYCPHCSWTWASCICLIALFKSQMYSLFWGFVPFFLCMQSIFAHYETWLSSGALLCCHLCSRSWTLPSLSGLPSMFKLLPGVCCVLTFSDLLKGQAVMTSHSWMHVAVASSWQSGCCNCYLNCACVGSSYIIANRIKVMETTRGGRPPNCQHFSVYITK